MQLSRQMLDVFNFLIEYTSGYDPLTMIKTSSTETLKEIPEELSETQEFVNSVHFLNEFNKLVKHYKRLVESELLERNEQ